MTIIMKVAPQITKQLLQSLMDCKSNFRYSSNHNQFDLLDVTRFKLIQVSAGSEYVVDLVVRDNPITNTIFIQRDNVEVMEVLENKENK